MFFVLKIYEYIKYFNIKKSYLLFFISVYLPKTLVFSFLFCYSQVRILYGSSLSI